MDLLKQAKPKKVSDGHGLESSCFMYIDGTTPILRFKVILCLQKGNYSLFMAYPVCIICKVETRVSSI